MKIAAGAGLVFLHVPILIIFLYAFTTEEKSYQFPPPGLTLQWFAVTWNRPDVWAALTLSVKVASIATAIALILGTLTAAAVSQTRFFGREAVSLLVILPIALPGIITGIALRSAFSILDIPFSTWTIVLGHATFCIVVVYNNAVARFRRISGSLVEASMDLGADGFQTFRYVILPNIGTALLAAACSPSPCPSMRSSSPPSPAASSPPADLDAGRADPPAPASGDQCGRHGRGARHLPADPGRLLPYPRRRSGRRQRQMNVRDKGRSLMDTELLIGSRFEPGTEAEEKILNPKTGGEIIALPEASHAQVDAAVDAAEGAFVAWSQTTPAERSGYLLKIADAIEKDADAFAALESLNCGKPINAVKNDELPAIVDCWRFFAGAIRSLHSPVAGEYLPGHTSMIRRDAVGIIGSIAPWNYPLMMMAWKLAPALAGGNTVVFKALRTDAADGAENGQLLADILPEGVVNIVLGRGETVGNAIINHPKISMVSITGDIATARRC